jgi:hypothetical protein
MNFGKEIVELCFYRVTSRRIWKDGSKGDWNGPRLMTDEEALNIQNRIDQGKIKFTEYKIEKLDTPQERRSVPFYL